MELHLKKGIFPASKHLKIFEPYDFVLDDFQKFALEAIENHHNVLVTAATGSGKTLIAEAAINQALESGHKVIYTSPIKSLSNQKFAEFKQKFNSKIGLITGDIKFNPDAQCLIMTTEILRNLLLYKEIVLDATRGLSLKVDIETEVAAVIFDEVHYINDRERGHVWEECLIMLPKKIDLVLLSATIDRAENFGQWLVSVKQKPLTLVPQTQRVIPQKHWLFSTLKQTRSLKTLTELEKERLAKHNGRLNLIWSSDQEHEFNHEVYLEAYKLQSRYQEMFDHREILNQMVDYLREHQMLPAIFFVFSRRKCQEFAQIISRSLNSDDQQVMAAKFFERHLEKLENADHYRNLVEYHKLKSLIVKGVAYHHSGLIPVFKEIVELLFAERLISVLICTETFSVGLNMPAKTVVFTGLAKFSDHINDFRYLDSAEFRQMAGRAGRRGNDNIGHVVILPNLTKLPPPKEMADMITGRPPAVNSHFIMNYNFVLRMLTQNELDSTSSYFDQIMNNSLWRQELSTQIKYLDTELTELNDWYDNLDRDKFPLYEQYNLQLAGADQYIDGIKIKASQKTLKAQRKWLQNLERDSNFMSGYKHYQSEILPKIKRLELVKSSLDASKSQIEATRQKIMKILANYKYVDDDSKITIKGLLATKVSHCQELLLVEMFVRGLFDNLNAVEISGLLAIFATLKHDTSAPVPDPLKKLIEQTRLIALELENLELKNQLVLDSNWQVNLALVQATYEWAKGEDFRQVLQLSETFSGNLIKEFVRISHISEELAEMAKIAQKLELLQIVETIPTLIVRDIVTIESLYLK